MQEVTEISNTLKTTAKELNIPIIALAQLNRNLMSRMGSNGKPVLSDLKDSGSIEQDADIVLFLHRPGLIGLAEDPDEQAKTEVIFAKNRNSQDFCSLVLFAVASYIKKYCNTYSTDGYDTANDDFAICVHVH